jgi:hypothetical protein
MIALHATEINAATGKQSDTSADFLARADGWRETACAKMTHRASELGSRISAYHAHMVFHNSPVRGYSTCRQTRGGPTQLQTHDPLILDRFNVSCRAMRQPLSPTGFRSLALSRERRSGITVTDDSWLSSNMSGRIGSAIVLFSWASGVLNDLRCELCLQLRNKQSYKQSRSSAPNGRGQADVLGNALQSDRGPGSLVDE